MYARAKAGRHQNNQPIETIGLRRVYFIIRGSWRAG